MKRYGMVIGVKPDHGIAYREAHGDVPPDVLCTIRACNIRNYSIFLGDSKLHSYFEPAGTDFAADMARWPRNPATQEWWRMVGPMQEPLPDRPAGEWWAVMEEVFHFD